MDNELNQNSYRGDETNGKDINDQNNTSILPNDKNGQQYSKTSENLPSDHAPSFFLAVNNSGQQQSPVDSSWAVPPSNSANDSQEVLPAEKINTPNQSIIPTALENKKPTESINVSTNLEVPPTSSLPPFSTEVPSRKVDNQFLYNDIGQYNNPNSVNYHDRPSFTVNKVQLPKSNSGFLKRLAIGSSVFVLLLVGTVVATEMGAKTGLDKYYNMIGMEKLWGGLPGDGKIALASSALKMEKIESAHYESETVIEVTSSSDVLSPLQSLLRKKTKFALAPMTHGRVLGTTNTADVPATSDDIISANMKIAGDYSPEKMQAKITLESSLINEGLSYYGVSENSNSSFEIDIKATKDKAYLRIPILSLLYGSKNNKWLEFEKSDIETYINQFSGSNSNPAKELDEIKKIFIRSKKVGHETINGAATAKYQASVDMNQLSLLIGGSKEAANEIMQYKPEATVYYWIGKKDYLTYKVSVNINANYEKSKIKIESNIFLTKFNESFEVEIPEEGEIDTNGLIGLMGGLGYGGTNTYNQASSNDAIRKSDLRSYKSALTMYQSDNGRYPISTSICKIGAEDCKVLDVLTDGGYIHFLATDPVEGRYYGYKCIDGENFELTAQLEDTSDTGEGVTNENGLLIYTLRNG